MDIAIPDDIVVASVNEGGRQTHPVASLAAQHPITIEPYDRPEFYTAMSAVHRMWVPIDAFSRGKERKRIIATKTAPVLQQDEHVTGDGGAVTAASARNAGQPAKTGIRAIGNVDAAGFTTPCQSRSVLPSDHSAGPAVSRPKSTHTLRRSTNLRSPAAFSSHDVQISSIFGQPPVGIRPPSSQS
jgi:hypothetical protein